MLFQGLSMTEYAKKLITPFNVVEELVALVRPYSVVLRLSRGLAAVTTASNGEPWGLVLCFGLLCGVPSSATRYALGSAPYLLGLKRYHPVPKNAILIGSLGYRFAAVFLLNDLGRPWRKLMGVHGRLPCRGSHFQGYECLSTDCRSVTARSQVSGTR